MEVILPEYSLVGLLAPLEFVCSTPSVEPSPELSWTVVDWEDQPLDHQAQPLSTHRGSGILACHKDTAQGT